MLIGEKVRLRPVERSDLAKIVEWRNKPRVLRNLFSFLPLSMAQQERWFEQYLTRQNELMFIIESEEGIPIGTIGLNNIDYKNAKAEYGRKIIGEDAYLGRGYATDAGRTLVRFAFQLMNMNRLYMETLADNERTIHVCQKIGFRIEGTLREAIFLDGAYHDILMMALLRREWQEREINCS